VLAYAAAVEKDQKKLVRFLGLTAFGGFLFLCGQYKEYFGMEMLGHAIGGDFGHWLAEGLVDEGLIFGASHYATTFYLITSFHGAHVTTGVIYLLVMTYKAHKGHYNDGNYDQVEICGLFWHFVDLVWILVFTFIYLIPEG
jgi:cytochrome c oxidase subunit 3